MICLLNRDLKYVFPFECLLRRAPSSPDVMQVEWFLASAPDPTWLAYPVPLLPVVVDFSLNRETTDDPLEEPGTSLVARLDDESGNETLISCACNCESECRSPVSLMQELSVETSCEDCRCVSRSPLIQCDCYDKYDLLLRPMDQEMQRLTQHHSSRGS